MADAGENLQEAQRRSDETESKSIEEIKGRTPDLSPDERDRKKEDEDTHGQENSHKQDIESIPSFDRIKEKMKGNEKGMAQSSKLDCLYYLKTGRCSFGRNCRYNHPLEPKERSSLPICKYFLIGDCWSGSTCRFQHKEPEPYWVVHKTESESSWPKKREIPENLGIWNFQEQIKRQRIETMQEMPENQNVGVQDNLQEIPEDQNVDTHEDQQNLEEKRQSDIQKLRREARLRLDQIKRTVEFNDLGGLRETIREFGIEINEDNGF